MPAVKRCLLLFHHRHSGFKHRNVGSTCKMIQTITEISAPPLVPEILLHLITPNCELWRSRPELCPVSDPYWAFLWPGGQGLCRYLLDNPMISKHKNVLDIGSGAGASVIAAMKCGAKFLLANDIDPIAITSMKMNIAKNFPTGNYSRPSKKILFSEQDILPKTIDDETTHLVPYFEMCRRLGVPLCSSPQIENIFDVVLVGDLFYDADTASRLLAVLYGLKKLNPNTSIFVGDPGRPAFIDFIGKNMERVKEYELPRISMEENYGFSTASVYHM